MNRSQMRSPHQDRLSKRISFLKNVSPFADLSTRDLSTLVDDFRLREYAKGEYIFHQGDHSRELYVVMSNKVRIYKTSPSGDETTICIFGIHHVIGEFAVIDGKPRSATAQAIGRCTLLQMTQDRFLQRMHEMPDLALGMCKLLTAKARWTAAYAETIAQYDAAGRLLHILLSYNEQFGQEQESGKRYLLELGLNQSDLASLVGARREWVNRLLRDWRERGLVEHEGGKIVILDLPRVQAERDSRIEAYCDDSEW